MRPGFRVPRAVVNGFALRMQYLYRLMVGDMRCSIFSPFDTVHFILRACTLGLAPGGVMNSPRRADNRQVYLVQPRFPPSYWGLESMLRLTPFRAVTPPLGLLTLAALTPPEYRVTLCDENAGERVDYDTSAQIVGITGYNLQNARVFAHAQRFRAREKP